MSLPGANSLSKQSLYSIRVRSSYRAHFTVSRTSIPHSSKMGSSPTRPETSPRGSLERASPLSVPVTIVMPPDVPQMKVLGTRRYGAQVVFTKPDGRPREVIAAEVAANLAESQRLTLLHPFNDSDVVLGHSSLGTELLQQLEAIGEDRPLDTLLVPAGGGGLAAGIALALRAHGSTTRLIAVEPLATTTSLVR